MKINIKQNEKTAASNAALTVTVAQAAALLNVSKKSIYRLCERGFFTPNRALRSYLIQMAEVEAFARMK